MSKAFGSPKAALITAALLPLVGCSSDTNWEEEVLVRLFRAADFAAPSVTVQASQGERTEQQTLSDPFDDCSRNRVRIVPRRELSGFPPVTLRVSVEGNPVAPVTVTVTVPAAAPVPIVLGEGGNLEPSGCLPADSGVPDSAGGADAGVKRAIGQPCEGAQQCAGGLCLDHFTSKSVNIPLPGGYCSRDCTTVACGADARCVSETDGLGGQLSRRCLRTCEFPGDCDRDSSYHCTTDSLCLPK